MPLEVGKDVRPHVDHHDRTPRLPARQLIGRDQRRQRRAPSVHGSGTGPRTRAPVQIPERKSAKFSVGSKFKAQVQGS